MKTLCLFMTLLLSFVAHAKELEKRVFEETVKFEGKDLPLRGLGLRKVEKFGLPFKVYVAGLYIDDAKATSAEQILSSDKPKVIQLQMLRRVSKDDISKAFADSHDANCAPTCAQSKAFWNEFAKLLPDLMDNSKLNFVVLKNELQVDVQGRDNTKGVIKSPEFSQNFLKIFLGPKPPTEALKAGMLGEKTT